MQWNIAIKSAYSKTNISVNFAGKQHTKVYGYNCEYFNNKLKKYEIKSTVFTNNISVTLYSIRNNAIK